MTGASPPSPGPGAADHTQVTGPQVTVRYWAAARAAAGIDSESVSGATLAEVLDAIHVRHPDRRFRDVIGICSIVVGERPVGARDPAEVRLGPGATVEFLPPFAGG